ncbi:MAG: hypothetical protein Q3999_05140 [Buchananella hordeovulneris]|nr:hypothetical protein [Buchananella hordeovulneris]
MAAAVKNCPLRNGDKLVGHTEPRIHTPPLRPLTPETSLGYSLIEFAELIGVPLLPWQQALAIRALELHPETGRFRFRTVVLLVARQNGKSTIAQLVTLWNLYVLQVALVLGTAQVLDVAEELWQSCVDLAEACPIMGPEVDTVCKTNGKKALELRSGARYKVAAATRRSGRGLSTDLLLLDELREHTTFAAWSASTKTTQARPRAQIWCMSNAGDLKSVVLKHLRLKTHQALGDPDGFCKAWGDGATQGVEADGPGEDDEETTGAIGLFEWSAAPGRDVWDRTGWQEANPALGYLITADSLAAAAGSDPETEFRTENLCQWVLTMQVSAFGPDAWEECRDPVGEIPDESPITYAVDVAHDRKAATVAVAGQRADGRYQVEICAYSLAGGWSRWIPAWFKQFVSPENPARVVVNSRGCPAAPLVDDLAEIKGLTVVPWEGRDLSIGAGAFYDRVMAAVDEDATLLPLAHRGNDPLTLAAQTATQKYAGDSWYWSRAGSANDASPLVAATGALWDVIFNAPGPAAPIYDENYSLT